MNNKPLISIIVPVYNTAKYLQRCFKSILQQTFTDFEIIAIDDGSTDDSFSILKNLQLQDKRIKIYSQQNQGLSSTRNRGISLSSADILSFVDSDDTIELIMLQEMYRAFEEDIDIVFARCNYLDINENIVKVSKILPKVKNQYFIELIEGTLPPSAPLGLYRKKLFLQNNIYYPKDVFFEDAPTTYKLVYYAKQISTIQASFYNYYHNPKSISNVFSKKHINDLILNINDLQIFLSKHKIYEKYQESYQKRIVSIVNYICYKIKQNDYLEEKRFDIIKNTFLFLNKYSHLKNIHISKKLLLYRNMILLISSDKQNLIIDKYCDLNDKTLFLLKKSITSKYGLFYNIMEKLKNDNIRQIYIYAAGELCEKFITYIEELNINIIAVIDKNYSNVKCKYNVISVETFYQLDSSDTTVVILSEFYAQEIINKINFKGNKYYYYM